MSFLSSAVRALDLELEPLSDPAHGSVVKQNNKILGRQWEMERLRSNRSLLQKMEQEVRAALRQNPRDAIALRRLRVVQVLKQLDAQGFLEIRALKLYTAVDGETPKPLSEDKNNAGAYATVRDGKAIIAIDRAELLKLSSWAWDTLRHEGDHVAEYESHVDEARHRLASLYGLRAFHKIKAAEENRAKDPSFLRAFEERYGPELRAYHARKLSAYNDLAHADKMTEYERESLMRNFQLEVDMKRIGWSAADQAEILNDPELRSLVSSQIYQEKKQRAAEKMMPFGEVLAQAFQLAVDSHDPAQEAQKINKLERLAQRHDGSRPQIGQTYDAEDLSYPEFEGIRRLLPNFPDELATNNEAAAKVVDEQLAYTFEKANRMRLWAERRRRLGKPTRELNYEVSPYGDSREGLLELMGGERHRFNDQQIDYLTERLQHLSPEIRQKLGRRQESANIRDYYARRGFNAAEIAEILRDENNFALNGALAHQEIWSRLQEQHLRQGLQLLGVENVKDPALLEILSQGVTDLYGAADRYGFEHFSRLARDYAGVPIVWDGRAFSSYSSEEVQEMDQIFDGLRRKTLRYVRKLTREQRAELGINLKVLQFDEAARAKFRAEDGVQEAAWRKAAAARNGAACTMYGRIGSTK